MKTWVGGVGNGKGRITSSMRELLGMTLQAINICKNSQIGTLSMYSLLYIWQFTTESWFSKGYGANLTKINLSFYLF